MCIYIYIHIYTHVYITYTRFIHYIYLDSLYPAVSPSIPFYLPICMYSTYYCCYVLLANTYSIVLPELLLRSNRCQIVYLLSMFLFTVYTTTNPCSGVMFMSYLYLHIPTAYAAGLHADHTEVKFFYYLTFLVM
jgi:hypothetical protein